MRRKLFLVAGAVLMVLGILGLAFKQFSYKTSEDVLHVGPVQATMETRREFRVPPLLAGSVLAVGAVILVLGWKDR